MKVYVLYERVAYDGPGEIHSVWTTREKAEKKRADMLHEYRERCVRENGDFVPHRPGRPPEKTLAEWQADMRTWEIDEAVAEVDLDPE